MKEFHQIPGTSVEEADLRNPRARAILEAARSHRDYSVVGLQAVEGPGETRTECLIIEVEVDRVPPNNRHGILYRERLAICVAADEKKLVEVLALRKGFPILIHQNQGVRGGPASLCLYFEPAAAVFRTWTPQNFLRRIQWWLEASSRDELHPADQPVEGLFFAARSELVLPWNADERPWGPKEPVGIRRGVVRPDGTDTFFLERRQQQEAKVAIAHVQVETAPIIHGFVERDPATLGELADLLLARGVDLIAVLRKELQQLVGPKGRGEAEDEDLAVVLLHVPVCREAGTPPERMSYRAYGLAAGSIKLGLSTGAMIRHDGRVFSAAGVLAATDVQEWRAVEMWPMEVLYRADAATARRLSGISEEGVKAILVGAGSLGSGILNLVARSGWGSWLVVDKDHIKPHNVIRHIAYAPWLGRPKAEVIAELCSSGNLGTSAVTARVGDACDPAVADGFRESRLVVDASAGLDYPRYASARDDLPRHVSVFITPSGEASVLMAEDAGRRIRLRSLEAQYYRALICEDWGARHLVGNLGSFWSGASCRDISFVLPYSRVVAHAGILAEQVRAAASDAGARIRVWHRHAETAATSVVQIAPAEERKFEVGRMDCYLDAGLEAKLRSLRQAALPNETGGVLLGYYDFNVNALVLVDALPAPPDSQASPSGFERGVAGLAAAVREASRRTAGIVGYVGEWHSHPRGFSARPSRDDVIQLAHLSFGMAADGLPGLQLIVGEHDIQVLQGVLL